MDFDDDYHDPRTGYTVTDSNSRKATPLYSGCFAYFPDALAAVSRLSYVGNEKHNPGQPLHWSRDKSSDHADCLARHLLTHGQIDPETGLSHTVAVAWRALAMLQLELERGRGKPTTLTMPGLAEMITPKPPKRRPRVYIAGPISKGDLKHNIEQATAAFKALAKLGAAPWCPQWSAFSGGGLASVGTLGDIGEFVSGKQPSHRYYAYATAGGVGLSHREWLETDLAWVEVADAVLRLPGESTGADEETRLAVRLGIPVFHSVDEVGRWMRGEPVAS